MKDISEKICCGLNPFGLDIHKQIWLKLDYDERTLVIVHLFSPLRNALEKESVLNFIIRKEFDKF